MYFSLAKSFYQAPLNKYLFTIANMSISGELTDGERLKLKFAELKNQKGIGKAEFARLTKFPGGASMVSQNVSNHKPISLAGAKAYALGFRCSIEEISPSLAASLPREDGAIATPNQPGNLSGSPGIRIDATGTVQGVDTSIQTIAEALALMTDEQREMMAGKLASLARAPDSPTLKKSISESLGSCSPKPNAQ